MMVVVSYCQKCGANVDPDAPRCPNCGSPVRFKFVRREKVADLRGASSKREGYIRPRSVD